MTVAMMGELQSSEINWYVSRRIELDGDQAGAFRLPARIVTEDGVHVEVGESLDYYPYGDPYRTYSATLVFPGVLGSRLPVEIDVLPFSEGLAELGLRPAARLPRFPVGWRRYFRAAWSVLDTIAADHAKARAATMGRAA